MTDVTETPEGRWAPNPMRVVHQMDRYPSVDWAGMGWVSELPGVGWLTWTDDAVTLLSTGGVDVPAILGELARRKTEGDNPAQACGYVLVDRDHSDPEICDLEEFKQIWDREVG